MFNQPYQVGTNGDRPDQCICSTRQTQPQDMIVVGSDGLWDNLHHNELGLHVNQYWSNPKHLASSIANACFSYSLNSSYRSPFYEKAQRVGLSYPCTGKSDDITVVVARVVFDYL